MNVRLLLGAVLLLSVLMISGCAEDVVVEEQVVEEPVQEEPEEEVEEEPEEESEEESEPEPVVDLGEGAEENETEELSAADLKIITIKNFDPIPASVTIDVGMTVRWRNLDSFNHIIGWNKMGFKPEGIGKGEEWDYKFEESGKYVWFSAARPTVQGTIYVNDVE